MPDAHASPPPSASELAGVEFGFPNRRESPGRRAEDYEHELVDSAFTLVRRGWRAYAVIGAFCAAISSLATFLLLVMGLKVGGATEITTLRADVRRRDSALDQWRAHTDSLTSSSALDIAHLKEVQSNNQVLLCIIAEQVGARTGGLCPAGQSVRGTP